VKKLLKNESKSQKGGIMKFNKLNSSFWIDKKVRSWDDKTRQLALYILTNPHRSTEGLYRLPKYYMAGDLEFKLEEIDEFLKKLIDCGFISYDWQNSLILIRKALKYDPTKNKNHQKAAIKILKELPKSVLFFEFLELAKKYNNSFAKYLEETIPEYFNNEESCFDRKIDGIPDGIPNGMIDGMIDGIGDGMGDSLELELALTPALKESQDNKKSADNSKSEKKFSESNSSESKKSEYLQENEINHSVSKARAIFLTKKLIDLITANNSRAAVPKKDLKDKLFNKWLTSIERLNRLGPIGAKESENKGYSWDEIKKIIEFSQDNDFWKSNILSASKLRKKVVILENQMQRNNKKNNSESNMDMLAELYASADGGEQNEEKRSY
jgi:hypothetical protein